MLIDHIWSRQTLAFHRIEVVAPVVHTRVPIPRLPNAPVTLSLLRSVTCLQARQDPIFRLVESWDGRWWSRRRSIGLGQPTFATAAHSCVRNVFEFAEFRQHLLRDQSAFPAVARVVGEFLRVLVLIRGALVDAVLSDVEKR